MLVGIALIIALFFAMNIGASGTAAAMGAAYGGGAVGKRMAVVLVGLTALAGAVIGGSEVVKTIGGGLIPSDIITVNLTIIILFSACFTLFIANLIGIPLSTSEVTVGSVVGVGIAFQALFAGKILFILCIWFVLPFTAFGAAYLLGKLAPHLQRRLDAKPNQRVVRRLLVIALITAGCYEAFSAGMNNVANAVGPLVGAGLIGMTSAIWLGGIFVAIGAILLGGRVLETNGKKITKLSLLQGSMVSFTSGTLVIIASIFGIPVPLTQATTMSIFGIGAADHGIRLWGNPTVRTIVNVWIVSPLASLVVSYTLVQLFLFNDFYAAVVVLSALIMAVGAMNYRKQRRQALEQFKQTG